MELTGRFVCMADAVEIILTKFLKTHISHEYFLNFSLRILGCHKHCYY